MADIPLQRRHNGRDGVSNHQSPDCLLKRLFRRRSKKTSKLRATGLCAGNSPGPVNSPHKEPVTRKMVPFYDVIMLYTILKCIFMNENVLLGLKFQWNVFLCVMLTKIKTGSGNGLVPKRRQAITWTNDELSNDTYICVTRPRWIKVSVMCDLFYT